MKSFLDEPRIIPTYRNSGKGRGSLLYKGYRYHWHSDGKNKAVTHWRCEQRTRCKVRIRTNYDMSQGIVVLNEPENHTHDKQFQKYQRQRSGKASKQAQNVPKEQSPSPSSNQEVEMVNK